MTVRRPLRLRWFRYDDSGWSLLLRTTVGGRELPLGDVERESTGPNTYRAVTATGTILRGNNRRRLQARLRGAVIQELAAICAAERKAGEREFERMLRRRNARIAKGRAA